MSPRNAHDTDHDNPPPESLPPGANLYTRIRHLVDAVWFLVIEALNTRHELEKIVSQQERTIAVSAAIKTSVARIGAELGALATNSANQIQQVKDAVANLPQSSPELEAALTDLETIPDATSAAADTLAQINANLVADDAPAEPTA